MITLFHQLLYLLLWGPPLSLYVQREDWFWLGFSPACWISFSSEGKSKINTLRDLMHFTCIVLITLWPLLVAQSAKSLPAMRDTRVQSLGWEDPLEKEMETHSRILAWRNPRTEEPRTVGYRVPGVAEKLDTTERLTLASHFSVTP